MSRGSVTWLASEQRGFLTFVILCSSLYNQVILNVFCFIFQQLKRELPKLQKGGNRSSLRKDKSFGKFTLGSMTVDPNGGG